MIDTIDFFVNNVNIFTALQHVDQFNASLLIKKIQFFKKKSNGSNF